MAKITPVLGLVLEVVLGPVLGSFILWVGSSAAEAPKFDKVFIEYTVIQHSAPVRLFGSADPGDSPRCKLFHGGGMPAGSFRVPVKAD